MNGCWLFLWECNTCIHYFDHSHAPLLLSVPQWLSRAWPTLQVAPAVMGAGGSRMTRGWMRKFDSPLQCLDDCACCLTLPGERWTDVSSSQIGHDETVPLDIAWGTDEFIGITQRNLGDSKSAAPRKSPSILSEGSVPTTPCPACRHCWSSLQELTVLSKSCRCLSQSEEPPSRRECFGLEGMFRFRENVSV